MYKFHTIVIVFIYFCNDNFISTKRSKSFLVSIYWAFKQKSVAQDSLYCTGVSKYLHNYLLKQRIRNQVSIIVESGGVRESHQICCLLGFGVDAICPYMSFESIKYHLDNSNIPYRRKEIYENYRNSINKGIYKIMSKMGISSLQSYKGAGKFETIKFVG